MPRVVITGLGCVSPFGVGVERLLDGIRAGANAFGPVKRFDGAKYGIDSAAEIVETDQTRAYDGSRPSRLLQTAADEALSDSGLTSNELPATTAIVLGTTLGSDEISHAKWQSVNAERVDYESVVRSMSECGARALVDRWHIKGPSLTAVTACAAGTNAIGLGLDLIRLRRADVVIVGGLDTLTELIYGGFANIGALAEVCRPFAEDAQRLGTVLGENAAVLVLESEEHAQSRSARIYAEVLGYGLSNDAYHMTAPSPAGSGAVLAMTRCLEDARTSPEEVDYVNAHGTGTSLNDSVELGALWQVFGDEMERIPVSSLKSQIGHGLSSGGAIEAIATTLALYHRFLPPTAHDVTSLDARVNFVQSGARSESLCKAVSNSFAFGGHAASLALSRWG
ncbi:beta-ketoacyl-[acyl-carrier-protein] synthase family protein [Diaminobutyricibacter sp. McL0618]|uniref:beta-ketoacyl-[acyl-carrier-protein] synthase family protein n=1 Tax=Leifsonia sp. McL0618 TaxID=3415677 RepID=UPI003CE7FEF9